MNPYRQIIEGERQPCNGYYQPFSAHTYAATRRSHSRRNTQFTAADWALVDTLLRLDCSPEQIAGRCGRDHVLSISHETINRYIWRDKKAGGLLYVHLRRANKPFSQTVCAL